MGDIFDSLEEHAETADEHLKIDDFEEFVDLMKEYISACHSTYTYQIIHCKTCPEILCLGHGKSPEKSWNLNSQNLWEPCSMSCRYKFLFQQCYHLL